MEFLSAIGSISRRAFLGIGATTMAVVLTIKKLSFIKAPKKNTARFLTRDGRLVEVDTNRLPFKKKMVGKQQLVSWVWKDRKL
jgi:hypothetical protein